MKKFFKILAKVLGVIILLVIVAVVTLIFIARRPPVWDSLEGHNSIQETMQSEKFTRQENIKWASPDGFDLTMDILTPNTGKESYPVVVIFHGGGWLINDNSIMDSMSEYLATNGEFVVCNVNYRLLVDQENTVLFNEIVEDAFGAVLWAKANIANYKGNPDQIVVTGDSAGAHLSAMVALQGDHLSSLGFGDSPSGFNPSWLPAGKSAEDILAEDGMKVQGALLSYGVYDLYGSAKGGSMGGFESWSNIFWVIGSGSPRPVFGEHINVEENPEFYKKVSPLYNIPDAKEKALPPILLTGAELDIVASPELIKEFTQKLKDAGHNDVSYLEFPGLNHAFLDSGDSFEELAPGPLDQMIAFMDEVFSRAPLEESEENN